MGARRGSPCNAPAPAPAPPCPASPGWNILLTFENPFPFGPPDLTLLCGCRLGPLRAANQAWLPHPVAKATPLCRRPVAFGYLNIHAGVLGV